MTQNNATRIDGFLTPEVSFVVPCYNVDGYIERCLRSLLVQSGPSFEIVCVDDGSTDRTPEILESVASNNNCIRIISKENSGLADARNQGVRASRGSFITFVDSDDFVSPSYLEALWSAHQKHDADIVVTDGVPVSEQGIRKLLDRWERLSDPGAFEVPRQDMGTMLLTEELPCSAWGKLVKREVCLSFPFVSGRFHEDVEIIASYYFSARVCAKTSEPLYGYFMRSGSITHASVPSGKQLTDFIEAYTSLEDAVAASMGCSDSALAYHRMLTACRFHSMASRSASEKSARLESQLTKRAERALSGASETDIPRRMLWRFKLLRHSPFLYDALFSLYERHVKGQRV